MLMIAFDDMRGNICLQPCVIFAYYFFSITILVHTFLIDVVKFRCIIVLWLCVKSVCCWLQIHIYSKTLKNVFSLNGSHITYMIIFLAILSNSIFFCKSCAHEITYFLRLTAVKTYVQEILYFLRFPNKIENAFYNKSRDIVKSYLVLIDNEICSNRK